MKKFGIKTAVISNASLITQAEVREELEKIADFIKKLDSSASYIAVPTRPPAEKFVEKSIAAHKIIVSEYNGEKYYLTPVILIFLLKMQKRWI